MSIQSFGQYLVNTILPKEHRGTSVLDSKTLNQKMLELAQEDPRAYVDLVSALKRAGDEVSTLEGISVGLDDIQPEYGARDAIVKPAIEAFKKETNAKKREEIILAAQAKLLEHTKQHPGSMTAMALSGARGNVSQLMKTVATPVASLDTKGKLVPWLVGRSYAEGLKASDHWVTGVESRMDTVRSRTAIADPGDMLKIITNNMYPLVITRDDCKTTNGLAYPSSDPTIRNRYLSKAQAGYPANTLVTRAIATDLRNKVTTVYVRSPMTCAAEEGICRKCQGLDEKFKPHDIGINVGLRAAQAITEPLTQFALGAKHGSRVLKSDTPQLEGIKGLRQLLEVPQSFLNKATLAELHGKITKITPAPHGGFNVWVNDQQHYVSPNLNLLVNVGQTVEAGDVLSEGIPKPDELVQHKGFGAGRQYLVDTLHGIYKNQNATVDKRHLELVARADLNNVRVIENSEEHPDLVKGELIPYDRYRQIAGAHTASVPVGAAEGKTLGREVLHFTAGTKLTPSIIETLKHHGVTKVDVSTSAPAVEFIMRTASRNPLLHPDWMARMSFRYLKESLLHGAHTGAVADIHGLHPVTAYAYGSEFGAGEHGRY